MSLPVLATAALLLGSAVVLTVVATNPASPMLTSLEPSSPTAGPASKAGGVEGQLDLEVRNEADPATVRLTAKAGDRVVFDEDVTLPARDTWTATLRVVPGPVDVRLTHVSGHVQQGGDLTACADRHAISTMVIALPAGGLLTGRFKGEGIRCADGTPAALPESPAEDEEDGSFQMEGDFVIPLGTKAPHPMCGFRECHYTYLGGSVGFEVDAPMRVDIRAFWDPTTPASERLGISLAKYDQTGSGKGIGGAEGLREVVFTVDLPEPGLYRLHGWPAGEPVGLVAAQQVNVEVLGTPLE